MKSNFIQKLSKDINKKSNEKLVRLANCSFRQSNITKEAEWLINQGIEKDSWNKIPDSEKIRIIKAISEGDYIPIVDKSGKPFQIGSGAESNVYAALGSPKFGYQESLSSGQICNAVVKEPKQIADPRFLNQYQYKKNLQGNSLNLVTLPHNDFEGAGPNRIASEYLHNPQEYFKSKPMLLKEAIQDFNYGNSILTRWLPETLKENPFSNLQGNQIKIPTLVDRNGNFYFIADLYAGSNRFINLGVNRCGKLKAMDYLAYPVTPECIEAYKEIANYLKSIIKY